MSRALHDHRQGGLQENNTIIADSVANLHLGGGGGSRNVPK
jgi:hypothetical protein